MAGPTGRRAIASSKSGAERPAADAKPLKLMRILQRQADGSWKMHRTMTVGEPGGE